VLTDLTVGVALDVGSELVTIARDVIEQEIRRRRGSRRQAPLSST
jgi:hypothetical protein